MNITTISASPVNERGGQTSYLLLTKGQFGTQNLTVNWVECPPGSEQPLHQHETQEQVYIITRGRGVMVVGDEAQEVSEGTLISIPKRTPHAIRNPFDAPMTYVAATSPPYDERDLGEAFTFRTA